MSKKSLLPQSRRHIHVFDEDWEWLTMHYGDAAPPRYRIGISAAIRALIHQKVLALRARQDRAVDALPAQEDLEDVQ